MADTAVADEIRKRKAAAALNGQDDEDTTDTEALDSSSGRESADTSDEQPTDEGSAVLAEEETVDQAVVPAEKAPSLGYRFVPVAPQNVSRGTFRGMGEEGLDVPPETRPVRPPAVPSPLPGLEPEYAGIAEGPAPEKLTQVERGELVKPSVEPAPDKLEQVERAELVKLPPEAPSQLPQVERGELVKVPPGTAPRAQAIPTAPAVGPAGAVTPFMGEEGLDVTPTPPKVQRALGYKFVPVAPPAQPLGPGTEADVTKPQVPQPGTQADVGGVRTPATGQASDFANRAQQWQTAMQAYGFNARINPDGSWVGTGPEGKEVTPEQNKGLYQFGALLSKQYGFSGQETKIDQLGDVRAPAKPVTQAKAEQVVTEEPAITNQAQPGSYRPYQGAGQRVIKNIIIHSSDGSEKGDINTLTGGDPDHKVSAHYYTTKDGRSLHFVADNDIAYHAGDNINPSQYSNGVTIGIEQEHIDGQPWAEAEVKRTAQTVAELLRRNPNLTIDNVLGHSDIAPERKQDPLNFPWDRLRAYVAADLKQGAQPGQATEALGAAPQAQPATKQANGLYENEKPQDFLTGKATTFATPEDLKSGADNGVGASRLGGLDTTQVAGVAVPEEALRAKYGNNYAAWRTARVDVIDLATGKRLRVPIVDLGPRGDLDAIVDMTPSISSYFGGDKNLSVKLVDKAGPDVNKNPQLFADEQAAIKQGFDSSTLQPGVQKIVPKLGYKFQPQSPEGAAQAQKDLQTGIQQQQDTISKLPESSSGNVIGLYKRLDQPVEGTTSQSREAAQASLKTQIIAAMREKYPEIKTDDEAWTKAQGTTGPLELGAEFGSKIMGYIQQIESVTRKASAGTDQFAVNRFLETVLPKGSDADKQDLLTKLYAMPPDQRAAEIENRLGPGFVEPGNPNKDPLYLSQALTRLHDPAFQQRKADELTKLQAEMRHNLSDDPRLKGTLAEKVVNNAAQLVTSLPQFATPAMWPLALAQINAQMREAVKAEHPEWDEKTLAENASRATLTMFFGQLGANKLIAMGIGPLLGGAMSSAKRIIAQALAAVGGGPAIAGGTQAATNIATGQPVGKGVGEAAESGLIQGVLGGLPHVGGEIIAARRGAPVTGRPPVTEQAAPVTEPLSVTEQAAPAPAMPPTRPLTAADVLVEHPDDIKAAQGDVLNVVAHNVFPDLTTSEARAVADRVALLSTRNLETERFRYELEKSLPQGVPYNFGVTTRLMQAYRAFQEGPSGYTAKEIASAERAFNALRNPQAGMPGALHLPIMWRELQARIPEPEQTQPPNPKVTQEDVARRTSELYDERTKNGQPGTALSDWTQAQKELSQATEPPPVTQGEAEPWVSAIANRFTAERTASGVLGDVIPGEGYSKEELLARGLQMGPEQIAQHVSDLMNNRGGDPKAQAGAVRAEEARLSQRSNAASRASEANPANGQLRTDADNAFKDLTDFHNGPVAKLKNNWHAQGMTLQGEVPIDLSTFNGMREKFLRDVGKPPEPKMEPILRKTAQRVRDSVLNDDQAMRNLGAEIERQTARRRLPTADEVRARIMERMGVDPCP